MKYFRFNYILSSGKPVVHALTYTHSRQTNTFSLCIYAQLCACSERNGIWSEQPFDGANAKVRVIPSIEALENFRPFPQSRNTHTHRRLCVLRGGNTNREWNRGYVANSLYFHLNPKYAETQTQPERNNNENSKRFDHIHTRWKKKQYTIEKTYSEDLLLRRIPNSFCVYDHVHMPRNNVKCFVIQFLWSFCNI